MNDDLKKLFDAVSTEFDIGTFEDFSSKMNTPDQRKSFYDNVSKNGYDLGDYNEYEGRLKNKYPGVKAEAGISFPGTITKSQQDIQREEYAQKNIGEKALVNAKNSFRNVSASYNKSVSELYNAIGLKKWAADAGATVQKRLGQMEYAEQNNPVEIVAGSLGSTVGSIAPILAAPLTGGTSLSTLPYMLGYANIASLGVQSYGNSLIDTDSYAKEKGITVPQWKRQGTALLAVASEAVPEYVRFGGIMKALPKGVAKDFIVAKGLVNGKESGRLINNFAKAYPSKYKQIIKGGLRAGEQVLQEALEEGSTSVGQTLSSNIYKSAEDKVKAKEFFDQIFTDAKAGGMTALFLFTPAMEFSRSRLNAMRRRTNGLTLVSDKDNNVYEAIGIDPKTGDVTVENSWVGTKTLKKDDIVDNVKVSQEDLNTYLDVYEKKGETAEALERQMYEKDISEKIDKLDIRNKQTGDIVGGVDSRGNEWIVLDSQGENLAVASPETNERKFVNYHDVIITGSVPFEDWKQNVIQTSVDNIFADRDAEGVVNQATNEVQKEEVQKQQYQKGQKIQYQGKPYVIDEVDADFVLATPEGEDMIDSQVEIPFSELTQQAEPVTEQQIQSKQSTIQVGKQELTVEERPDGTTFIPYTDAATIDKTVKELSKEIDTDNFDVVPVIEENKLEKTHAFLKEKTEKIVKGIQIVPKVKKTDLKQPATDEKTEQKETEEKPDGKTEEVSQTGNKPKTTFKGVSNKQWKELQEGQPLTAFLTSNKASTAKKDGTPADVLIEFKPEAVSKMTEGESGIFDARNLTIDDVLRVTDSSGKVIYGEAVKTKEKTKGEKADQTSKAKESKVGSKESQSDDEFLSSNGLTVVPFAGQFAVKKSDTNIVSVESTKEAAISRAKEILGEKQSEKKQDETKKQPAKQKPAEDIQKKIDKAQKKSDKKQPERIKNVLSRDPESIHEAILQYFVNKGKVNSDQIKKHVKGGSKEQRTKAMMYGKKGGRSIDTLYEEFQNTFGAEDLPVFEFSQMVLDVIDDHSSIWRMVESLEKLQAALKPFNESIAKTEKDIKDLDNLIDKQIENIISGQQQEMDFGTELKTDNKPGKQVLLKDIGSKEDRIKALQNWQDNYGNEFSKVDVDKIIKQGASVKAIEDAGLGYLTFDGNLNPVKTKDIIPKPAKEKPQTKKPKEEPLLHKVGTVNVIEDDKLTADNRFKVDKHIVEYRDEQGNEFRKSFSIKRGEDPVIPESGTHDELNALKDQVRNKPTEEKKPTGGKKEFTFMSDNPMRQGKALAALSKSTKYQDKIMKIYEFVESLEPGLKIETGKTYSPRAESGYTEKLLIGDHIAFYKAEQDYYTYLQNGGLSYSEYLKMQAEEKRIQDQRDTERREKEREERNKSQLQQQKEFRAIQNAIYVKILSGEISRDQFIQENTQRLSDFIKQLENKKQTVEVKRQLEVDKSNLEVKQKSLGNQYDIVKKLYKLDGDQVVKKYDYKVGDDVIVTAWNKNSPTKIENLRENPDGSITYVVEKKEDIPNQYVGYESLIPVKPQFAGELLKKPEKKPVNQEEYRYQLTLRPFDIGTYPKEGFVRYEPDGSKFGTVIYDRKLDPATWSKFDLSPIQELNEIASKTWESDHYEKITIEIMGDRHVKVWMYEKEGDEDYTDFADLSPKELFKNINDGYFREKKTAEIKKEKPEFAGELLKSPEQPVQKLEDWGEKVEGAKKDQIKKYFDKINLNGKTLSTIFPKPDIKALIESGLSLEDVAGIKVAHEFATKDKKKGEKFIKFYASYAKNILAESINLEYISEGIIFTEYGKSQIELRTQAFQNVAEKLGNDYLLLDLSKVRITDFNNVDTRYMVRPDKGRYQVQYYVNTPKYFDKLEDAIKEFTEQVKANTSTETVEYKRKLGIYRDGSTGSVMIAYKPSGKPLIRLKEGFKTAREAFDYKENPDNMADLQLMLERIVSEQKSETSKGRVRLKYSNETARDRVGKDWRNGKDIGSKELAETFGFRAIEFGNWVNQKERQVFVNNTFDSFMDLAQLLNIPPQAISLNGNLGITFGSRGSGIAAAHYESDKKIINLTKTKGLGSLAHEWWHSVDNYFTDFKYDLSGMKSASNLEFKPDVRPEVKEAFKKLYNNVVNNFSYRQRSQNLDATKSKDYFRLPHEMSARAFENFILKRLNESGQINDFIVNYISNDDWNGDATKYPYPIGDESVKIYEAFNNLFDVIQTREENGRVAMFRRSAISSGANMLSRLDIRLLDIMFKFHEKGLDIFFKDGVHVTRDGKEVEIPEDLKSAADEYDDLMYFKNNAKFRISGETAAGNLARNNAVEAVNNLNAAKELEKQGKDEKTIWMATGWQRGKDGKWRFESNDIKLKLDYNKIQELPAQNEIYTVEIPLGDVVEDKNLFKEYPEFKDYKVVFFNYGNAEYNDKGGFIDPKKKIIAIGVQGISSIRQTDIRFGLDPIGRSRVRYAYGYDRNSVTSLLSHEVQHYIQRFEGFDQGGDREQVYRNIKENKEKQFTKDDTYWTRDERTKDEIIQERLRKELNIGIDTKQDLYERIPGEVEARNVQTRMNLTPEERASKMLSETEDVHREDQIRLINDLGTAKFRKGGDLGLYSNAEDALSKITQNKATPEQWKAMILNNGGKQNELDWIGWDEFVKDKKSLTKDEIANFIATNKVELFETRLGEGEAQKAEDLPKELADAIDAELQGAMEDDDVIAIAKKHGFKASYDMVLDNWVIVKEGGQPTKYYGWRAIEGGENYKEFILRMPRKPIKKTYEQWLKENYTGIDTETARDLYKIQVEPSITYTHSHWQDITNPVVHIRADERTMPDGRKILLVQEFQSDWQQQGRKKGFRDNKEKRKFNTTNTYVERIGGVNDIYELRTTGGHVIANSLGFRFENSSPEQIHSYLLNVANDTYSRNKGNQVPDMPFKSTDQWLRLAFRRMLVYASEKGFDGIAWTTGEQQVELNKLSKHIEAVLLSKDGTLYVTEKGGNNYKYIADNLKDEDLPRYIGKELSERLLQQKRNDTGDRILTDLDEKVGGEGMKDFYENIVPNVVNKEVKKFGVKTAPMDISTWTESVHRKRWRELKDTLSRNLDQMQFILKEIDSNKRSNEENAQLADQYNRLDESNREIKQEISDIERRVSPDLLRGTKSWAREIVHHIPITDQMRESVMEGLPMFKTGVQVGEFAGQSLAYMGKKDIESTARKLFELKKRTRAKVNILSTQDKLPDWIKRQLKPGERPQGVNVGDVNYMIVGNMTSEDEAIRTFIHEVGVHDGLSNIIPDVYEKRAFFERVVDDIGTDRIRQVVPREEWGLPKHLLGEEFMAYLAEKQVNQETLTMEEKTIWQKFIDLVNTILKKLGIQTKITESDILEIAKDAIESNISLRQADTSIGRTVDADIQQPGVQGDNTQRPNQPGVRFAGEVLGENVEEEARFKKSTPPPQQGTAQPKIAGEYLKQAGDVYAEKQKTKRNWNETYDKIREYWQDYNLPIRRFEETVIKNGGKTSNSSKPYRDMNLSFGRQETLFKKFSNEKMEPVIKSISKLINSGIRGEDVLTYVIAKHAIERNREFRDREYNEWMDGHSDATQAERKKFRDSLVNKDYSGVTEFDPKKKFDNPDDLAKAISDDFEAIAKKELVDDLWKNIRTANTFILDAWVHGGQISDKQRTEYLTKFKNFVPLRGWREGAAKELVYVKGEGFSQSLKHAEGRKSLAENPLAYIQKVAFDAIGEQVANEVNNAMLNLVVRNQKIGAISDLATVKKLYYVKDNLPDGSYEWEPTLDKPPQELFESGDAKVNIYNEYQRLRTPRQAREHEVIVHRPIGDAVIVFKNEALDVAQAMNKQNFMYKGIFGKVKDARDMIPGLETVHTFNNFLKAAYTSWNIVFPFTNFIRDAQESTFTQLIKGDDGHKIVVNYKKAFPAIIREMRGKSDMNNPLDRKLEEFKLTGGITGYTHLKTPQEIESELTEDISRITQKGTVKGEMKLALFNLKNNVEQWNRLFEDATRFSVYLTSLELGKSKEDAAMDAKEASVNFNRKGKSSKAYDALWAFWNVSIQSMQKNLKLAKDYPKAFTTVASSFVAMGFIEALFNHASDDDDEDKENDYYNITPYMRHNYLIIPDIPRIIAGKPKANKYISIPLPQFWRGFHALGVLAYEVMDGKTKPGKAIGEGLLNFGTSLLPIDIGGFWASGEFSLAPIVPTVVRPLYEVSTNTNYMGYKIAKEPFTKAQEKELADSGLGKANVNQAAKFFTDMLFRWGGGFIPQMGVDRRKDYISKSGEEKTVSPILDINPSYIEHLFKGYTGGTGAVVSDLLTTAIQIASSDQEVDFKNIPFVNKFIREIPESKWAVIREFYDLKDDAMRHKGLKKGYKDEAFAGGDAEKYNQILGSEYYNNYQLIFEAFEKRVSELYDSVNLTDPKDSQVIIDEMQNCINTIKELKAKYNKR